MKRWSFAVAALVICCGSAWSQDADQLKKEKEAAETEAATLKAQADILKYKYGAEPLSPKTGNIEGADKLVGMAQQHAAWLTTAVGSGIALDLTELTKGTCPKGVLLVDGDLYASRYTLAKAYENRLGKLEADVKKIRPAMVRTRSIDGGIGTIAAATAVFGLFRADYTVASGSLVLDQNWLAASIVKGASACTIGDAKLACVRSERFPTYAAVDAVQARLDTVEQDIAQITNELTQKEKKAKADELKRVDAEHAALSKSLHTPDASGTTPLQIMATYGAEDIKSMCVARLSTPQMSPVLLTKETIFGKGGRAYLNIPVQVSAVVMNEKGTPVKLLCRQGVTQTAIKLSDMLKEPAEGSSWDVRQAKPANVIHCHGPTGTIIADPV